MASNQSNQESRVSRNADRYEQGRPPRRGWRLFRRILLWLTALIVVGLLAGTGLFFYYVQGTPKITQGALASDNSTRVYDANGAVISRLGAQNRTYVKAKNIPTTLKQAVVSIEDRRFYKNNGVDPIRILGAAFANLTGSSLGMQGGSTLTQQLVKLSVFSTAASDRTLRRKAQEAWLALKVDREYSKDQILEYYINKVYMGNGVYGMQTAAQYYYNKSLSQLSLPQLALLAGMPQSPTSYDPNRYPEYAKERRDTVLTAMVQNNVISATQAAQAKATSIKSGLAKTHKSTSNNPKTAKIIDAYLKQVYAELRSKGYNPTTDGLKVYTTLNMSAQEKLYDIVNTDNYVAFPSNKFQVGATMVNPNNGQVLAMIGGRKTGDVSFGLNRAVQKDRSSGSTMKPLMDYGPAIEDFSYPTYQPVEDTPYMYPGTNTQLYDWDHKYQGTITMRKALVESRNVPAIRTLQAVGIPRATTFLKGLGITQKKAFNLQNGIGAYISSQQEAAAYAAFANGGTYYKPYMVKQIVTQDGKKHNYAPQGNRAMSPATAFMITDMLKGVINSSQGSGTAAAISGLYQAGKTGTIAYPDDFASQVPADATTDSWFTGYTKNFSLSVWTGYDKQFQPGGYVTQAQTEIAQQIYRAEMSYVQQTAPNTDWTKPNNVGEISRGGSKEYYIYGHEGTVADASNSTERYGATNDSSTSAYNSNSQAVTTPGANSSSKTEASTPSKESSSTEQTPGGGNGTGGNGNANKDSSTTTSSTSSTSKTDNSDSHQSATTTNNSEANN